MTAPLPSMEELERIAREATPHPSELRDVAGYEGLYAITQDGHVWAYPRTWRSGRNASLERRAPGRWLKPGVRNGYPAVCLSMNGAERSHSVHRLVAEAWIPNPEGKPQVNHVNGDKLDPRAQNLEWATPSENVRHAWSAGLSRVSERMREHGRSLPRAQRNRHCARGHEYTAENAITLAHGGRACRACQRLYDRRWKQRRALLKDTDHA